MDDRQTQNRTNGGSNSNVHIGKTCPFCQFPIKPDDIVVICPSCSVGHHLDCWAANGNKCTTFGCRGRTQSAEHTANSQTLTPDSNINVTQNRGTNELSFNFKIIAGIVIAGIALLGFQLINYKNSNVTAPSQNPQVIKVGGNLEMTGEQGTFGQSVANGVLLALKELNSSGGVLGRKIEFIIEDNVSEPAKSAQAMDRLINQRRVVAVIGAVTSSDSLAASPIAHDRRIPFISPSATNPRVTFENGQVKKYAFRTPFIDPFQGTVAANFAYRSLGAKKAAIFVDNSSDYSKGIAMFFEDAFTKYGGRIVAKEAYIQRDTDFSAGLARIRASNPDVILCPGYYQEVGLLVRQARAMNYYVPILGGDGWDSPKLVEIAGASALTNTYFVNHYAADDTTVEVQRFVLAYKKEYNQTPDALAALGFDAALVLVDAIKRAGSTDPEKIRDAMEKTSIAGVTGQLTFNAYHNPIKSAVIIRFNNGHFMFHQRIQP